MLCRSMRYGKRNVGINITANPAIPDVLNLGVCNILFHYKFPFPLCENSTLVKSFLSTFFFRIRCCWDQASRKSLFYSVTWTLCGIWFMRPDVLLLDDPIIHGFFPTADKSSSGRTVTAFSSLFMNSSYNVFGKLRAVRLPVATYAYVCNM